MSRFTRTVSAAGGASGGDSHSTHCSYEWEVIASCNCWDCCYSGELSIDVDSTAFNAFKLVLGGVVINCSGNSGLSILPRFSDSPAGGDTGCHYWCCNSYVYVQPWCNNGCNGFMYCRCYCTGGCRPEISNCCGYCLPMMVVGCIFKGINSGSGIGMHGFTCAGGNRTQDGRSAAMNWVCWIKNNTGYACWESFCGITAYSGLGGICPRWNAGETCGICSFIPHWVLYGNRPPATDIAATLF